MTEKEFEFLLDKFLNKTITEEEEASLIAYEKEAINKSKNDIFFSELEKKQVEKSIYRAIKKEIKRKNIYKIGVAASMVLLIGLSSFFFLKQHNNTSEMLIVTNRSDQVKKVNLIDGSIVFLNKNSELKYNNNFRGTRHLDLEGEAFFEIKRNENKPFIVKTQNIKTKVLGTSFNISDNDSIIKVTVATGVVEVFDAVNAVTLKPNQQTKYKISSKSFTTKKVPHELAVSWFKESIYLEKVSMKALADFIRINYGTQVQFTNKEQGNIQMSLTIKKNESLEKLLEKINYISDLKLTLKQNNMIEVK
ncbi:FecR family protein [Algibacter miyuki]|uniref:FecR family protein n=1 Tax=Algibacter miyuki TaxID=1306933 RepID=A0ABV5H084_9FLAO|nr:FecR family protein [Algibacter miyuki]MDN3667585.1 FecR family protein [Algibacter miyuki]